MASAAAAPAATAAAPAPAEASHRGRSFPAFPYTPYGIQEDLMRAVYATLDEGGLGVFESPTGTARRLQARKQRTGLTARRERRARR
jgi:chromosome transmission fidelity protein 1